MLTAYAKDSVLVVAPESDGYELRLQSQSKELVCTACGSNVFYRAGSYIPHFVHYRAACLNLYGEPESKEHLAGKWAIYTSLKSQGLDPALERFFPETGQRADVSVTVNGDSIAIEVQMSHISVERWEERRKLYLSMGVRDYWYFGCHPPSSNWKPWKVHPIQEFVLDGYPQKGTWEDTEEVASHYSEHVRVSADVHIESSKFAVNLSAYIVGFRRQTIGSPFEPYFIPMDKCRFIRGVPDFQDGRILKTVRDWVSKRKGTNPRYRLANCLSTSESCLGWPHISCRPKIIGTDC